MEKDIWQIGSTGFLLPSLDSFHGILYRLYQTGYLLPTLNSSNGILDK